MTSKSHVGQCARVNVFVSSQFSKVFFSALLEPDDVVRRKLVLHFRPDCLNKNTFHCHVIGQFHHHLLLNEHNTHLEPENQILRSRGNVISVSRKFWRALILQ